MNNIIFILYKRREGQSLAEILIAVVVGTMTILVAISVLVLLLRVNRQDVSLQTAGFLGQEASDRVKIVADRNWDVISGLTLGSDYHIVTSTASGTLTFLPGKGLVTIDGVDYSVAVKASSAYRDVSGALVSTGGVVDELSRRMDVVVEWTYGGATSSSTINAYITRSNNATFLQTTWAQKTSPSSDLVVTTTTSSFYDASSTITTDGADDIRIDI